MLEFGLPRGGWRPLWELYVRAGLPTAGALVSPGWREVGRFLGHTGAPLCVVVTPDGRLALSGGQDGTVRLWSLPR